MHADVVQLETAPKNIRRTYKEHTVTFHFDKERRVWSWHFTHTQHTEFNGKDCPTLDDAIKRAYKNIDLIMG